jgi:hypothetical protein
VAHPGVQPGRLGRGSFRDISAMLAENRSVPTRTYHRTAPEPTLGSSATKQTPITQAMKLFLYM